jgi:hypothetical protein
MPGGPEIMLRVTRVEAREMIQKRILEGQALLKKEISTEVDLDQFRHSGRAWLDYNTELLLRIFTTDQIRKEYSRSDRASTDFGIFADQYEQEIDELRDEIRDKLPRLHSILHRLELIPESQASTLMDTSENRTDASLRRELQLLVRQASALGERVTKIIPEAADKPGRPGSGITEAINPYNSYLDRAKRLLSADDAQGVIALNEIPRQEQIQERLAASYHKTAKERILNGLSDLMAILESRISEMKTASQFELETLHREIHSKCYELY